jgi:predicted nucleotidyltransferase
LLFVYLVGIFFHPVQTVESNSDIMVIIYGGGWHRREKGWVNKILSEEKGWVNEKQSDSRVG